MKKNQVDGGAFPQEENVRVEAVRIGEKRHGEPELSQSSSEHWLK